LGFSFGETGTVRVFFGKSWPLFFFGAAKANVDVFGTLLELIALDLLLSYYLGMSSFFTILVFDFIGLIL